LRQAIVDSCFLSRFKKGTDLEKDFFTLIKEGDFDLCIHPYIYENELDMFPYVDELISKDIFHVMAYESFLRTDSYKEFYKGIFIEIYNEFADRMEVINPRKAAYMKRLDDSIDIFTYRSMKSSLGDVHLIMLALFADIPIILSEDSIDLREAFQIAKAKMNRVGFSLKLYCISDLIDEIDANPNKEISHSELRRMKRAFGKS